ncbi:hypothetical protein D1970_09880 [Mesobacillus zeae]|uniref:Uncharacterized protein n=1 Tax=Mesobacillus zeae TaxID=1917180 RepID=A0A398B7H8_9BACI|nr:hypothetical protein D1970_09880 [Mesobacillus zeae]
MLYIVFLVLAIIGAFWFLNLVTFLKNLKSNKSTHNQTVLGVTLTFIFIPVFMYELVGLH